MDEKRRVGRCLSVGLRDVGAALEKQRVRPAVAPDDPHRESATELAVEGVVMRDGRDSREKVLERAYEQSAPAPVLLAFPNERILSKLRPHVVDPRRRVVVRVAELHPAEGSEVEMVVSDHETGGHETALDGE